MTQRRVAVGIAAALFAASAWSLTFLVPAVIGDYSIFDFYLVSFAISGVLSAGLLILRSKATRRLKVRDWLVACWLGWIGYLGYSLALTGATINAGPVLASAFLGMVPVVLGIAGNLRQRTVAWRNLVPPLTLAVVGLFLVNWSNLGRTGAVRSLRLGIPLAILVVILWTWFGLLNQSALVKRPQISVAIWTALMLGGAALGMIAFVPVGLLTGVFEIPRLGLHWKAAAALYIWSTVLAVVSNIGGALAWTFASKHLPIALAAQLITMEPAFGAVLALSIRRQWPTSPESVGMVLLLVGVVIAVQIFHGERSVWLLPKSRWR